jgi:hypothetical protein
MAFQESEIGIPPRLVELADAVRTRTNKPYFRENSLTTLIRIRNFLTTVIDDYNKERGSKRRDHAPLQPVASDPKLKGWETT